MSSSSFPSTSRHLPYTIMNRTKDSTFRSRTIIAKFGEKITDIDLRVYFAMFGEIINLSLRTLVSCNKKYAFITYKMQDEAAAVLKIKCHLVSGVTLEVEAASNYPQSAKPEAVKLPPLELSSSSSDISNPSLLSLNDDCLFHLFSFLNMYDLLPLSRLCSRIGEIIFKKIKRVYAKQIKFRTREEALNVFRKLGRYVKHYIIWGSDLESYYIELLPPLCLNLKSLEFVSVCDIFIDNIYKRLLPIFSELDYLVLAHCDVKDNIFIYLKSCLKLTKLNLAGNRGITGEGLSTLPNTVMELDISENPNIEPLHFINLCKVAKFKIINIGYCIQLFPIAKHLIRVESLEGILMCAKEHLGDRFEYESNTQFLDNAFFEELVRKKSATLQRFCLIGHDLNDFQKYALCKFSNLKCLYVSGVADDEWLSLLNNGLTDLSISGSWNISEESIVNLVEKFQNIQSLDIGNCQQLHSTLFLKLFEKLKILQRPTCLQLYVCNSDVWLFVRNKSRYKECKQLLELIPQSHECRPEQSRPSPS